MHLGQLVSEVLKITPRKHSEIKFHQNCPLNLIAMTFLFKKKKKGFNELFPSTSQSRWCVRGSKSEGRCWTDMSRGHRCPDTAEHLPWPQGTERSPRQSRGRKAKLLPQESRDCTAHAWSALTDHTESAGLEQPCQAGAKSNGSIYPDFCCC